MKMFKITFKDFSGAVLEETFMKETTMEEIEKATNIERAVIRLRGIQIKSLNAGSVKIEEFEDNK